MEEHDNAAERLYYQIGDESPVFVSGMKHAIEQALSALQSSHHKDGVVASAEDGVVVSRVVKIRGRARWVMDLNDSRGEGESA